MSSVVATLMDLARIPLEPDIWSHLLATGGFSLAALSPTYLMRSTRLWKSFQARQMLSKRLTAWLGKSESTTRDPIAPVEGYSDVEDPFGHGGTLDAEEEEESDRDKRNGCDSREEYQTNKLVLGTGVVHHRDETWLLRGITFCGKCGAWGSSAPRRLTHTCRKKRVHAI